jgi:thiopurine S-methyltransferase
MDSNEWKNFWLERWQNGQTPWHQEKVEAFLTELSPSLSPTRVFLPLCGKSKDLLYFKNLGHEVIGVDLSEKACEAFFIENKIDFHSNTEGCFTRYQGNGITLFAGDFFNLTSKELMGVTFVYDRAALIALPEKLRAPYARHLQSIVPKPIQIFLICLAYDQTLKKGPPFSVSEEEVRKLYGDRFQIEVLGKEAYPLKSSTDTAESIPSMETVYFLREK